MDKMYVGSYWFDDEETKYYTDDWKGFFNSNGEKVSEEDIKTWVVNLNSPWFPTNVTYYIRRLFESERTNINLPKWRCENNVIVYDYITVSLVGYGDTPEKALKNTEELFVMLQEVYNKENIKL